MTELEKADMNEVFAIAKSACIDAHIDSDWIMHLSDAEMRNILIRIWGVRRANNTEVNIKDEHAFKFLEIAFMLDDAAERKCNQIADSTYTDYLPRSMM